MWVKVGDTVEVITGDDAGVKAKVKAIDHDASVELWERHG